MNQELNLKTLSETPLVEIDLESSDIWIEDHKVWDGVKRERTRT